MIHEEQHNPWTIIDTTTVYDNKWLSVIHHNVLNPAGGKGIYGKVHFKNKAIGVIAVDKELNTYLVGQYRFPINQYSWEIPEGGAPLSEISLDAAKRELLEETGLKADKWVKLGDSYLSNSVCDEYAEYFLATELSQHTAEPEETEQLMVKKLPLKEVFAMADDGRIKDALSLLPLQKLELMLLKGEIEL
jgi:8-oxo-dGTP pyrophosphatase MutT (NUDIX family)